MEIEIGRHWYTVRSTIGILSIVDDPFQCFTIEDVARAPWVKIPKQTAIMAGRYEVTEDYSNRHGCTMPHILGVPMFEGIRFDVANYAEQVEGCVAVGASRGQDAVWSSRQAWAILCEKISAALQRGEKVFVTIKDEQYK